MNSKQRRKARRAEHRGHQIAMVRCGFGVVLPFCMDCRNGVGKARPGEPCDVNGNRVVFDDPMPFIQAHHLPTGPMIIEFRYGSNR